jgi:hypothetical protein
MNGNITIDCVRTTHAVATQDLERRSSMYLLTRSSALWITYRPAVGTTPEWIRLEDRSIAAFFGPERIVFFVEGPKEIVEH